MGQQPPRISRPPTAPADAQRAENRHRLREFLRATPRTEANSQLELLGLTAGTPTVVVTRAQLTASIEKLRPQTRQVIRLTLEERWTRKEAQEYLHDIGARTLEREQVAGLDEIIDRALGHS
ncbi:MAG TPA: hypothetical protein VKT82_28180 [Ktedonobacterales bacterium]|nr:hypothetical protein [Ktedonobacterales bacterium]